MFVDASALCVMIAAESDAEEFLKRLETAKTRTTSPLAIWETVINVSRLVGIEHEAAERAVGDFLSLMGIAVLPIEAEMTGIALDAYRRYGKRRHPANLNFGDCFAYACAVHHRMPLLFKGNDFSRTDVKSA